MHATDGNNRWKQLMETTDGNNRWNQLMESVDEPINHHANRPTEYGQTDKTLI
jgi:hypothetical protein